LALGTGARGGGGSSDQTRKLGYKGFADLFRAGYDQGINFWDSADQYGNHSYIREALKSVPREKVVILFKNEFDRCRFRKGRSRSLPPRAGR
jgi:aryl-alcohol dehydrogenase-like predicted oxidoreductase